MARHSLGILITYCNEKEFLTKCLLSFKLQAIFPDEIIIYDDASDFPAEDYIPRDFPMEIKIIRGKERLGPGNGRNIMATESNCQFIHFHDSDDILMPDWSKYVHSAIADDVPDFLLTDAISLNWKNKLSRNFLNLEKRFEFKDFISFVIRNPLPTSITTYKREFFLSIGGFRSEFLFSEDYDLSIRSIYAGAKYKVIPLPLVLIHIRQEGRTLSNPVDTYIYGVKILKNLSETIEKKYYPDLVFSLTNFAGKLMQLGAHKEAKLAFSLAEELGDIDYFHPSFKNNFFYRFFLKLFGPYNTEKLRFEVRKILKECSVDYRRRSSYTII